MTLGIFLLVGSILISAAFTPGRSMNPWEEVVTVYFALTLLDEVPESLTTEDIRDALWVLGEDFTPIADRVSIRSYSTQYGFFNMTLTHRHKPGKVYTLNYDGVY